MNLYVGIYSYTRSLETSFRCFNPGPNSTPNRRLLAESKAVLGLWDSMFGCADWTKPLGSPVNHTMQMLAALLQETNVRSCLLLYQTFQKTLVRSTHMSDFIYSRVLQHFLSCCVRPCWLKDWQSGEKKDQQSYGSLQLHVVVECDTW